MVGRSPWRTSEGQGLNPLLQDPGLAFHPPTLYAGYVGLSVAFSFAVGALVTGQVGPAFARAMRPWVLGAWVLLTIGITASMFTALVVTRIIFDWLLEKNLIKSLNMLHLIRGAHIEGEAASVELGQLEQVTDEPLQAPSLAEDDGCGLTRPGLALGEGFGVAAYRCERCAQVVGDREQELALESLRALEALGHGVDRTTEGGQLVVAIAGGDACRQITGGDAPGRLLGLP